MTKYSTRMMTVMADITKPVERLNILLLFQDKGCWITYYSWLDDAEADFKNKNVWS